jgi:hypothetical protein
MSPMLSLVGGGAEGVGCWHAVAKRTARKAANKINLPVKSLSITLYFLLVLLLPIKVYLASVAVALTVKNQFEHVITTPSAIMSFIFTLLALS